MRSCTHRKEPQQVPLNNANFLARGVNNIFQELCSMQLDGREVWKERKNLMLLSTAHGFIYKALNTASFINMMLFKKEKDEDKTQRNSRKREK